MKILDSFGGSHLENFKLQMENNKSKTQADFLDQEDRVNPVSQKLTGMDNELNYIFHKGTPVNLIKSLISNKNGFVLENKLKQLRNTKAINNKKTGLLFDKRV